MCLIQGAKLVKSTDFPANHYNYLFQKKEFADLLLISFYYFCKQSTNFARNQPNKMQIEIEEHPLQPFLPPQAKLLMLGSFPPQKKRWSMDFYYPNLNNDMWRIVGLLFFQDKNHFLNETRKAFCREPIIDFLNEKGIALFDTASSIRRLQDNASDKFLEVVKPTDIAALLRQIPLCKAIITTGQKATDTLRQQLDVKEPKVGDFSEFIFEGRAMRLYRMPSSSRAYPLALDKKAAAYKIMYQDLEIFSGIKY